MGTSTLITEFIGRRWRVFRMAFWYGLLTVLTLGLYRFWMKTRLRRYYWSGTRPGGHPLEYTGDPLEKLLGFLIAVVILAFYIGVVNLLLMFASFSLFEGAGAGFLVTFVGVIPLWFYARYRARRYVLGRTRWRAIRFGVDGGAWGYTWRALLLWTLTILSLGLLWPLMTHRLERFRIERTWYGDLSIMQKGSWLALLPGALPALLAFWSILALAAYAAVLQQPDLVPIDVPDMGIDVSEERLFGIVSALVPLFGIFVAYYNVRSFRVLTRNKHAGDVRFTSGANTFRVIWIYVAGYTLAAIVAGIGFLLVTTIILSGVIGAAAGSENFGQVVFDRLSQMDPTSLGPQIAGVVLYFLIFVAWGALTHAFVTMPLWRHYAQTFQIHGAEDLEKVRQRARDEHTEAEGFAEALDLGAAI